MNKVTKIKQFLVELVVGILTILMLLILFRGLTWGSKENLNRFSDLIPSAVTIPAHSQSFK